MTIQARQKLVPSSKYSIKCPYSMDAEYITFHNTYNDATADGEISYMISNNNETSFHFAIDDKEVVQGIPLNRSAWHCGDGGKGTGNRKSIGIEVCYSKSGGDKYKKAELLAIKFIAQLLHERKWTIDRVKPHKHWSGKNCPHRILNEGRWQQVLDAIAAELKILNTPKPIEIKPESILPKEEDEMLERAILIGGYPEFDEAELVAVKLKAPIYFRNALPQGKIAKELYIIGGSSEGLVADKIINLSGNNRIETLKNVLAFLGK